MRKSKEIKPGEPLGILRDLVRHSDASHILLERNDLLRLIEAAEFAERWVARIKELEKRIRLAGWVLLGHLPPELKA